MATQSRIDTQQSGMENQKMRAKYEVLLNCVLNSGPQASAKRCETGRITCLISVRICMESVIHMSRVHLAEVQILFCEMHRKRLVKRCKKQGRRKKRRFSIKTTDKTKYWVNARAFMYTKMSLRESPATSTMWLDIPKIYEPDWQYIHMHMYLCIFSPVQIF